MPEANFGTRQTHASPQILQPGGMLFPASDADGFADRLAQIVQPVALFR